MGDGLRLSSGPAWGLPEARAFTPVLCVSLTLPTPRPCPSPPRSLLLPQVPSAPRRFRIRQPNPEVINLEWDHPEHPNGILIGYTLRYAPCTFCPASSSVTWGSETVFSAPS